MDKFIVKSEGRISEMLGTGRYVVIKSVWNQRMGAVHFISKHGKLFEETNSCDDYNKRLETVYDITPNAPLDDYVCTSEYRFGEQSILPISGQPDLYFMLDLSFTEYLLAPISELLNHDIIDMIYNMRCQRD